MKNWNQKRRDTAIAWLFVFPATFAFVIFMFWPQMCIRDSFKVAGEDLFFEKENVAQAFLTQGVYPIRPEQFHMEKEGLGLKAVVTNKQYNGREIHYTVNYKNQLFTVYAGAGEEYEPGEEVRLILSCLLYTSRCV